MKLEEFFKFKRGYPVFRTTREVKAVTLFWLPGSAPCNEEEVKIPADTLLTINSFSNYGYGHSMSPVHPVKVFNRRGYDAALRFAVIPYDAMEFEEYREDRR